jgi:hypothetical protein
MVFPAVFSFKNNLASIPIVLKIQLTAAPEPSKWHINNILILSQAAAVGQQNHVTVLSEMQPRLFQKYYKLKILLFSQFCNMYYIILTSFIESKNLKMQKDFLYNIGLLDGSKRIKTKIIIKNNGHNFFGRLKKFLVDK